MRTMIVIAALGLAACDEDTKDTGAEQSPVAEGEWDAEEISETDTCGFFGEDKDTGEADQPITLTLLSDTSFTFSDGTDELNVTCELAEDLTFSCPGGTNTRSLNGKGLDASILADINFSGAFESRTTGTLTVQIDATCDGSDCIKLKKYEGVVFPCGYTSEQTISLVE